MDDTGDAGAEGFVEGLIYGEAEMELPRPAAGVFTGAPAPHPVSMIAMRTYAADESVQFIMLALRPEGR